MNGIETELTESFLLFAEDALFIARSHAEKEGIPTSRKFKREFFGGGHRMNVIEESLFSSFFDNRLGSRWEYPDSAKHCARMHFDAGIFKLPKKPDGPLHDALRELTDGAYKPREYSYEDVEHVLVGRLSYVLINAINKSESLCVSSDCLEITYREYRDVWAKRTIRRRFTVPLVGFDCDTDEIVIEGIPGEWSIVRFDEKFKSALWNLTGGDDPLIARFVSVSDYNSCQFALTTVKEVPFRTAPLAITNDWAISRQNEREIFLIVTALRLANAGECGARVIMNTDDDLVGGIVGAQELSLTRPRRYSQSYRLSDSNLESFTVLAQLLGELELTTHLLPLENALRRFNLAFERDDFGDGLLDLVIALESSLLHGVHDNYKACLKSRGAAVLSDTINRSEVEQFLGALYAIRGKMVHEGLNFESAWQSEKPLRQHWATVREEAFDICRRILLRYLFKLSKGWTLDRVNEAIDRLAKRKVKNRVAPKSVGRVRSLQRSKENWKQQK